MGYLHFGGTNSRQLEELGAFCRSIFSALQHVHCGMICYVNFQISESLVTRHVLAGYSAVSRSSSAAGLCIGFVTLGKARGFQPCGRHVAELSERARDMAHFSGQALKKESRSGGI